MRRTDRIYLPGKLPAAKPGEVILAVAGKPIAHSMSPQMQRAALDHLAREDGRFASWDYLRIEVAAGELAATVSEARDKGFAGLNCTIPLKEEALALADCQDELASRIGAANTLAFHPDGVSAWNTDGDGLLGALRRDLGFEATGKSVVLLGAGGAARSAAFALARAGCRSFVLLNRTRDRADAISRTIRHAFPSCSVAADEPGAIARWLPSADCLINGTSLGLHSESPALPLNLLSSTAVVFDIVYSPTDTALVSQARSLGHRAADGRSMLVLQGCRALEIWTGRSVDPQPMFAAVSANRPVA